MPHDRLPTFGELTRHHRETFPLTQRELASRAGLSENAISGIELGLRTHPHPDTVRRLATALGLTGADLDAFHVAALRAPRKGRRPAQDDSSPAGPLVHVPPVTQVGNLPSPVTALLGREREVAAVAALLRRDDVRLVTITGPGGIGKTRLAMEVAADVPRAFPDGVWWVRLARLSAPEQVVPALASTLDIRADGAVPPLQALRAALRDKRLLLVLDNFEHVAEVAIEIAELIVACRGLTILTTSRVPLQLHGERVFALRSLATPAELARLHAEELADYAATALFLERAQAVDHEFAATPTTAPKIAAICAQLEGVPLAIELAAARVSTLSLSDLEQGLTRGLALLVNGPRDVDARQRTMRATLAWSYDLLSEAQQCLFRRLAVFVGGWTLAAAQAVCAALDAVKFLGMDVEVGLHTLVDQSLVQLREEGGESRFGMLRIIREYALEQFEGSEGSEAEALRRAHARYYLALAERAEPELTGPEQGVWLERLEGEHANMRVALGWAREHRDGETGLRLAGALGRFWTRHGYLREGRAWVETLLAPDVGVTTKTPPPVPTGVRARALSAGGLLAMTQLDYGAAERFLEEALVLARAADDRRTAALTLCYLGIHAFQQGNWEGAAARYEESLDLWRAVGDRWGIAIVLGNLGDMAVHRSDLERAGAAFAEALALARAAGDRSSVAGCLFNLGWVARKRGEVAQATTLQCEGLALAYELGELYWCAVGLEHLVATAGMAGQGARAARLLGAAMVHREQLGALQTAVDREDMEQAVAAARAVLGEERWAADFAAGQALSLDEAIAEALDDTATTKIIPGR